jgi:hypothetical protein
MFHGPNQVSRRFALINADQKKLPRMNAKDTNLLFVLIREIGDSLFCWSRQENRFS